MPQRAIRRANADEIDSHWCHLIENMEASPQEFYLRLEQVIRERKIPNLESGRIEWREGGVLSAKRLYFRLLRERIVIDICAAPFGTGFFVSWRLGQIWLRLNFLGLLMILWLVCAAGVFGFSKYQFELLRYRNIVIGAIGAAALLAVIVFALMRNAVSAGMADLDALFLHTPVLAGFYERFLRPVTYYRIDLATMYQAAVHAAVTEVIDEMTEARKLPRLTETERKPILRDYYKR
jgi:hypothetical protein